MLSQRHRRLPRDGARERPCDRDARGLDTTQRDFIQRRYFNFYRQRSDVAGELDCRIHTAVTATPLVAASVQEGRVSAALLAGATDDDLRDPFPAIRLSSPAFDGLVRRALRCASEDEFEARIFEAFDLLSRASYGERMRPPEASLRIQYVKRIIERHLSKPLTIDALAARVHLSPFTLIRQFKSAVKTTPHAYLVRCRLAEAKHLLCDESIGIAEIAERIGLVDANYFARFFRHATGFSPSGYRLYGQHLHSPAPIRCKSATNAGFQVAQPSLEYSISK
jgi:AraC-like DNA-binding protein